jgi:hypothetical protein
MTITTEKLIADIRRSPELAQLMIDYYESLLNPNEEEEVMSIETGLEYEQQYESLEEMAEALEEEEFRPFAQQGAARLVPLTYGLFGDL